MPIKIDIRTFVPRFGHSGSTFNIRTFVPRFGHSGSTLTKRKTARFCSQLKMMLSSGLPLLEALNVIKGMASKVKCQDQLAALIEKITEGFSLSEGAPGLLPPLAICSLRAAEKAGNMEEVLESLSKYYENKAEIEEKVIGALVYPCFVLILCLFSFLALVIFVLPGMKELFADLGGELPIFTLLILNLGDFAAKYGLAMIILVSIIICPLFFRLAAEKRERLVMGFPLMGKLMRQEAIIQGFGTLGMLLKGGSSIMEALSVTANSSRGEIFRKIFLTVREEIGNGERLSDSVERTGAFPKEVVQMLKVGENSGKIDEMLLSISDFNSKEREEWLKRFTTMLEPAMTLSVGVVVGFMVIALFLPLMNVISGIK